MILALSGATWGCDSADKRARDEALAHRVAWLEHQIGPTQHQEEGEEKEQGATEEQRAPAAPSEQPLAAPENTPVEAPGGDLSSRVDTLITIANQNKSELGEIKAQLARIETKLDALDKGAEPKPAVRPGRPDPDARYRVDVDSSHSKGPANAKITVVIFSDFQCPFCKRVESTLDEVERRYKADVRFVFRHNPLAFHKDAMPAAKAAEAAGRQGKFWEMHALLFENNRELTQANFERWAGELGLNVGQFKRDMNDPKLASSIDRDQKDANKVGARGTPAFFINGRYLSGAQPFSRFEALIDEEIKEADRLIASGTSRARVYETLMKDAKTSV